MKGRLGIVLLTCMIIFLTGEVAILAKETSPGTLKDQKITMKFERVPLSRIFWELMNKYDVAIGFEESTFDRWHSDYGFETNLALKQNTRFKGKIEVVNVFDMKQNWFDIDVKNGRLEDVLDSIVGQMKYYDWEINDDVVNIFPIQGRDGRYEELLNLEIKTFRLEKGDIIGSIMNRIFDLPEVSKFLSENKIHSSYLRSDTTFTSGRLLSELDFSNLKLRELLNKITKVKRGGWLLRQNRLLGNAEEEFIQISI